MESELQSLFEEIDSEAERSIAAVQVEFMKRKIETEEKSKQFGFGFNVSTDDVQFEGAKEQQLREITVSKGDAIAGINEWREETKKKALEYLMKKARTPQE